LLPLKLSDQQLQKFIEIHYAKHGELLEPQEALEEALRLLKLVELVESNVYKDYNHRQ